MSFSGTTNNASAITVQNDGWWPDFSLEELQKIYHIPTEYAPAMVADRIRLAMAWANKRLNEFKAAQKDAGRTSLVLKSSEMLDDDAIRILYYRRAVFAYAKADLLQNFKTVNCRAEAENEAKEGVATRRDFVEMANEAINKFKAVGTDDTLNPCEVALI